MKTDTPEPLVRKKRTRRPAPSLSGWEVCRYAAILRPIAFGEARSNRRAIWSCRWPTDDKEFLLRRRRLR